MTNQEYKEILKIAIGNEVEAYEFYKGVSEKAASANIRKMFSELAEEEQGHKKLLEGFLSGDISNMKFNEVTDYKVAETVDKPKLSLDMKPADALALAMKNEEEAMNMYTAFAAASASDEQKKMFENLAIMEKGHKVKLEEYYVNAAHVEVW